MSKCFDFFRNTDKFPVRQMFELFCYGQRRKSLRTTTVLETKLCGPVATRVQKHLQCPAGVRYLRYCYQRCYPDVVCTSVTVNVQIVSEQCDEVPPELFVGHAVVCFDFKVDKVVHRDSAAERLRRVLQETLQNTVDKVCARFLQNNSLQRILLSTGFVVHAGTDGFAHCLFGYAHIFV